MGMLLEAVVESGVDAEELMKGLVLVVVVVVEVELRVVVTAAVVVMLAGVVEANFCKAASCKATLRAA